MDGSHSYQPKTKVQKSALCVKSEDSPVFEKSGEIITEDVNDNHDVLQPLEGYAHWNAE